jgi:hypothetical protein
MFLAKSTSPRALKTSFCALTNGQLQGLSAFKRELTKPAEENWPSLRALIWPITGSNAVDAQKRMYQACGWSDVGPSASDEEPACVDE